MNQSFEKPQKILLRNTASFVDWTPGLYVKTTSNGVTGSHMVASPRSARTVASHSHRLLHRYGVPSAQSGRMFWNNTRTGTTKGELSIIDGICQNRSETQRAKRRALQKVPTSHVDAWRSKSFNNMKPPLTHRSLDSGLSVIKMENWTLGPIRRENMNLNDEHVIPRSMQNTCRCIDNKGEPVPQLASLPNSNLQKYSFPTNKPVRIPPIRKPKGGSYVQKYTQQSNTHPNIVLEKTVMEIYLPNVDIEDSSSITSHVPTLKYTTRASERSQSVDGNGTPIHPFQVQGSEYVPPAAPFNTPSGSRATSPQLDTAL